MFNLNIPDASSYLGIEGAGGGLCSTPRTPELLNALFAMTNPLDVALTANTQDLMNFNIDSKQLSQNSNHSSGCGSPLNSPANATTPTLNQTKSQLIKAGLKISIQSKRKRPTSSTSQTCDSSSGSEMPVTKKCKNEDESSDDDDDDDEEEEMYDCNTQSKKTVGLTAEDEDRRRRRRERNKIAATKCRLKKREKTNNLIKESEQLDAQNIDLKSQVKSLELERRSLLEMLQLHANVCTNGFTLAPHLYQSPAYKYFNVLDLNQPTNDQQSQEPRKVIPPMSTIKYSRQRQQQQQQSTMTLPLNGYLKEEPTHISTYEFESCSSSSDGLTNDLVKHELVDSQSPYTTAQSADRFLYESNETSLDIKNQINNNSNMLNNNTLDYHRNDHSNLFNDSSNGNTLTNSCNIIGHSNGSTYDPMLSKAEFLNDDTVAGLLEQVGTELVDLDTGFSTQFQHMTNEGCLA